MLNIRPDTYTVLFIHDVKLHIREKIRWKKSCRSEGFQLFIIQSSKVNAA